MRAKAASMFVAKPNCVHVGHGTAGEVQYLSGYGRILVEDTNLKAGEGEDHRPAGANEPGPNNADLFDFARSSHFITTPPTFASSTIQRVSFPKRGA